MAAAAMFGPIAGFRLAVSSLAVAPSVRSVRPSTASCQARPCARLTRSSPAPQKLEAAGFGTRGDLENIGPIDLARGACGRATAARALTR